MRRNDPEQIVEPPDTPGKVWLGQNPAASQSAQSIDLCEAIRGNKFISQVERGERSQLECSVEIDFIDEHSSAGALGDLPYPLQGLFVEQSASWIVKIGQDEEAGARTDRPFEFAQVDLEIIFELA